MTRTIYVQAKDPSSKRMALWERDEAHPGGEVMVSGDKIVEVAMTTEVTRRLAKGILVEVDAPENPSLSATWQAGTGPRPQSLPVPSVPVGPVGAESANPPQFYVETTDGEVWQTLDGKPVLFVRGEELDGETWEPSDTSRAATDAEVETGMPAREYLGTLDDDDDASRETASLPLPEDIASILAAAGYATPQAVQAATDATLLAIAGIGNARLALIRETLPYVASGEGSSG